MGPRWTFAPSMDAMPCHGECGIHVVIIRLLPISTGQTEVTAMCEKKEREARKEGRGGGGGGVREKHAPAS